MTTSRRGYAALLLFVLSRSVGVTGELFYDLDGYSLDDGFDQNTFGLPFGVSAFVF